MYRSRTINHYSNFQKSRTLPYWTTPSQQVGLTTRPSRWNGWGDSMTVACPGRAWAPVTTYNGILVWMMVVMYHAVHLNYSTMWVSAWRDQNPKHQLGRRLLHVGYTYISIGPKNMFVSSPRAILIDLSVESRGGLLPSILGYWWYQRRYI